MEKAKRIKDWQKMYDSLTDPEQRKKSKQKHEIEKHLKDKKDDTGL